MKLIYSNMKADTKPSDARPYQKKTNYTFADVNIADAARLIGEGRAWRAGLYDNSGGSFKKQEVRGAQLIALDFDACPHEPQEIVNYGETIGLLPNFWYYSYSQGSKPHNNFRVVWCLEDVITPKQYEDVYKALLRAFAAYAPDEATKDCSRLWYGGNSGAHLISDEYTHLSNLGWQTIIEKAREGKRLTDVVKGKKACIDNYAGLEMPESVNVLASKPWWEPLRGRCRLWDLYEGGHYLNYNQRLTLFSNLKFLKYDSKNDVSIVKDIMTFYRPDVWAGHTFNEEQLLSMLRERTLRPLPIVRITEFEYNNKNSKISSESLSHYNIYSSEKGENTKNQYKNYYITIPEFFSKHYDAPIYNTMEKCTLEELDAWMDENVPAMLDSPGITYLKSQTGSGKTERILRYLAAYPLDKKKVIYAAPTHKALEEFEERFAAMGGACRRVPQQNLSARDIMYLQLGLPKMTKHAERRAFLQQMIEAESGLFVITHALLVNLKELRADLIIIDENIEDALLRTAKINVPQLGSIMPFVGAQNREALSQLCDEMREKSFGDELSLDAMRDAAAPFLQHIDEYLAGVSDMKLIPKGYFGCLSNDGKVSTDNKVRCVRILQKSPLIEQAMRDGTPIKLFTATPKNKRLENYYGATIDIIVAPLASNRGKIVQFTGVSGAKGLNYSKVGDMADYMKKVLPQSVIDSAVLFTFKDDEDNCHWEQKGFHLAKANDKQIHLANNAGLDCFKGMNIIVAGKMDKPDEYYQDMWADIGDGTELKRQNISVETNGYKQTLYLYDKPQIREEQLQFINYAIEQTSGRARALREAGANVYVFSNYIISDVDFVI